MDQKHRRSKRRTPRRDFVRKAKARIREMSKNAEDVTKELGLPPSAKYDVLEVMYGNPDRR